MKKIITAVAVLALSTALFAGEAEGNRGKRHGREGKAGAGMRGMDKLNLTDEQKAQVRELNETFREGNQPLLEKFKQAKIDMKAARDANDTKRSEELKGAYESLRLQMEERRKQHHEQMLNLLTEAQKALYEAEKSQRKSRNREQG